MQRSIWKGVIAFGMVSIPVKLFSATENKDITFHLLHRECNSRLKQVRYCPVHEREVQWEEITRGFEYAKDRFVVVTPEELEKLPVPSKHVIELSAFVKAEEIDPIFYQKGYYLQPDEMGVKPYALLMRALSEKGLTALARVTLRTKERMCALRPHDDTLVMETLFHADEIRIPERTDVSHVQVTDRELAMASNFIDLLSEHFEPQKYPDEYRAALQSLIEAKLQGREIVEQPLEIAPKIVDLMSALKASVEAAKRQKGSEPAAEQAGTLETAKERQKGHDGHKERRRAS